jgi:protein-S-isoprenylcysteine O-methyltransferase Ste14
MKTTDLMIKHGNWFFRYRSFLPIVLIVLAMVSIWIKRDIYYYENIWFDLCCLIIAISGEVIRILAVGYAADRTSGRNTKQQVADEINQTGIYSILRHPLYLGNFFMWLGIALYTRIGWLVLIFIAIYILYYERIILAEENFLESKFGTAFMEYANKVNAIIPSFKSYLPNKFFFRIKKVIRQENSSLYGVFVVFIVLEIAQDLVSAGKINLELHWKVIGISFTLLFFILLGLKKHTRFLHGDNQRQKVLTTE